MGLTRSVFVPVNHSFSVGSYGFLPEGKCCHKIFGIPAIKTRCEPFRTALNCLGAEWRELV